MQIVRLLADENEEGDRDLFSSQSTSLIATHPTVYRAQCPLNQYGKFGITAEHKIRLCTQPNQPIGAPLVTPKDVCLYDHFGSYSIEINRIEVLRFYFSCLSSNETFVCSAISRSDCEE